jgi:hypothetical protein
MSFIFPAIFPTTQSGTSQGRSHNASFAHAGTSKNDWTPPSKSKDIYLASVHANRENDSKELILKKQDGAAVLRNKDAADNAIQKVTHLHSSMMTLTKHKDVEKIRWRHLCNSLCGH